MSWRIKIVSIAVLFWSCNQVNTVNSVEQKKDYIIESSELMDLINLPSTKILDFRDASLYNKSHIIHAINISRRDIEDTAFPYSGVMASKTKIEQLFSKLGINSKDTIVIYDDNGMCEAARLWWVLQNYNFQNVKLLNGGMAAWLNSNGELSTVKTVLKPSQFKLPDDVTMKYLVSKEELNAALEENTVIIDTRSYDEFTGKHLKKGASRAGRIPKSVHVDWATNINFSGDKRFRTKDEIEKNYAFLNLKKNQPIILYCHSGVRSAHTTFVLTQLLGFENVKNYDGSWVEWSYHQDLPIEIETF